MHHRRHAPLAALISTALVACGGAGCKTAETRLPSQPPAPTAPPGSPEAPLVAPPAPPAPTPVAPSEPLPDVVAAMLDGQDAAVWADATGFTRACREAITRAEAERARIRAGVDGAIPRIEAFDAMTLALDTVSGLASLLFNVSPSGATRDAAGACREQLSAFTTAASLDRSLYETLLALGVEDAKPGARGLDATTVLYVKKLLRDFRRAGVGLDDAARIRVAEINAELVTLSQQYTRAINGDVRTVMAAPADLEGLPEDWLAAHPPRADGQVVITTDYPDFFPVQTYAKREALRRTLYEAHASRGFPANGDTLRRILALRKELAALIGHPNWADYVTGDKMSGSAAAVETFIREIHDIIRPRAEQELTAFLARKRQDDAGATAFEVHDRFYYMQLIRKEQASFDALEARKYFAYARVKEGVFKLYGQLFGLEFARLPTVQAWHPGVEAWEMRRDGKRVGRFFLDMHPRADKYKHAAMFTIQSGLAEGRIPWASLVCNFPEPSVDGRDAALMEHRDVTTFFHEFGHLIHQLLARKSRWLGVAGIETEWDFVEAPSQLLEEWAWDAEVLRGFARHVDTGEAIPASLVAAMRTAEELGRGIDLLRQVYLSAFSFYLHLEDPVRLDFEAFTAQMYKTYAPFPKPAVDHLHANFGHLMGYSAIYYTYQWSLAIAKDLFTRFRKAGLMNTAVARDYAAKVLEPGGTRPADELIRAFLGRPRNLDAYRAWIVRGR